MTMILLNQNQLMEIVKWNIVIESSSRFSSLIMDQLLGVIRFRRVITEIMVTSSNGNIFPVIGHLCGEFTAD